MNEEGGNRIDASDVSVSAMEDARPGLVVRWRPWVAGVAGVAGSSLLLTELDGTLAVLVPMVALLFAAIAAHGNHLGAQLYARAAWWSNLLLGLFITVVGSKSEMAEGVILAWGCGGALLVADRRDLALATARGKYSPVAYRGTLQLLMVFALADTLTLLLLGSLAVDGGDNTEALVFFSAAAALIAGFVGLYRLAAWGFALTMGTSAALGVLVVFGRTIRDNEMVTALVVLCVLQLMAPLPMIGSMLTGRRLPAVPSHLAGVLRSGIVVLIVVAASIAALRR